MPKKASTYKLVRKKITGTVKGRPKKAPVTKERELTKSLIETLKKKAKSKGVKLKSLLTEKEIKTLTERAHNKALETIKRVKLTNEKKVNAAILELFEKIVNPKEKELALDERMANYHRSVFPNDPTTEYKAYNKFESRREKFKKILKISANKKHAMFEINGNKYIISKEELFNILQDRRIIRSVELYSWDFGELFKDMKYNSSPKAKEYFDTIIEERLNYLTYYSKFLSQRARLNPDYRTFVINNVKEFFTNVSSENASIMKREAKLTENIVSHLSKAGVPIEKLKPLNKQFLKV